MSNLKQIIVKVKRDEIRRGPRLIGEVGAVPVVMFEVVRVGKSQRPGPGFYHLSSGLGRWEI